MYALLLLWSLLTAVSCAGGQTATSVAPPPAETGDALVRIGSAAYTVDLAVLPEERRQGLSGREYLAQDSGMLFVFEEERQLNFWMKDMRFPLDIIWIDAGCRLLEVAADVPTPPPDADDSEVPRAYSPSPARYVLEVNAGEAARNGLAPGDPVQFLGSIYGRHGC